MKETTFREYSRQMEHATNSIDLKEAIKTRRKGGAKLVDRLVFFKYAWSESLSYFAIVQTAVVFFGLIDRVVININAGLWDIGTFIGFKEPYQFPVNVASYVSIMFIAFIFVFGIIAVRTLGTTRRGAEIGTKLSPNAFLLWTMLTEVMNRLEKLENENKQRREKIYEPLRSKMKK